MNTAFMLCFLCLCVFVHTMVLLLNNHPEISVVVCIRIKRALNKGFFIWRKVNVGPARCVTRLPGQLFHQMWTRDKLSLFHDE